MLCPIDGSELMLTVREGIEIDYCPKCRGVWLDRGELDKIIERAGQYESGYSQSRQDGHSTVGELFDEAESEKRKRDYLSPSPSAIPRETTYAERSERRYVDDDDDYEDGQHRRHSDDRDPRNRRRKSFLDDLFDIFD